MIETRIRWFKRAKKDFLKFPDDVRQRVSSTLRKLELRFTPSNIKPLRGFGGGAVVMEIVVDYRTDTYRAFYTTKIGDVIYVLHCIQKKSKTGIALSQQDKKIIEQRLKAAREDVKENAKE